VDATALRDVTFLPDNFDVSREGAQRSAHRQCRRHVALFGVVASLRTSRMSELIHPRPLLGESTQDGRPYLALNMVATVDGRAAVNGSAVGIGSPADKHLMRELRAEADVVLHGAGTVRADQLSARIPAEMAPQRQQRGLVAQP